MKEIALNILDIVQNSLKAGARNIHIQIKELKDLDLLEVLIEDDGSGIDPAILDYIEDPYTTTRTTRKVGLGIPLLKYHSELCSGSLDIQSKVGIGTRVTAVFRLQHIDRQPLGDISGVIRILLMSAEGAEIFYKHITDMGDYSFSSKEVKQVLEVDSLSDFKLLEQLKEMISENLRELESEAG